MINNSFKEEIKKITSAINKEIQYINEIFNQNQMLKFIISVCIDFSTNMIIIANDLKDEKEILNDESNKVFFSAVVLDEIPMLLNKFHLLNSHITFRITDIYNTNESICEVPSTSLIIPRLTEVIKTLSTFLNKNLTEDNYILGNEDNIDFIFFFHDFLPKSSFDLLIYKNRIFDLDSIDLLKSKVELFLHDNFGFDFAEGGTRILSRKYKVNLSLCFVMNYNTDFDTFEKSFDKILKNVKDIMNTKINNLVNNSLLKLNFNTIISSLDNVYKITPSQEIFEKYQKLFEDEGEPFENKLYKNFILGAK